MTYILTKEEKAELLKSDYEFLRRHLKPGSTVYTTVQNVSRSGMSRHIKCFIAIKLPESKEPVIVNITRRVSNICGYRINPDSGGLVVGGCGMDMGFSVVYGLSRALYPKGFKVTPKTCHRNGTENGKHDNDGGYAVGQAWL